MKHYIIILISIFILPITLLSQNKIEEVLKEVEKNNTSLSALRKSLDAEKLGNKTGIFLQNPEVGFNYLWGKPSAIGTRKGLSFNQSFDFPTAYKYRNQIANIKNEQIELEYQKHLRDVLFQTKLICNELVYNNALKAELTKRLHHAQTIANAYKAKFDAGETNIIEYNKAQLNLLNTSKQFENIEIERAALNSELTGLNGGIQIAFNADKFEGKKIADNFENWYLEAEKLNPVLSWLKQEIEINQKNEKLNKALSLPKFQAGYMSEQVIGEKFQGITVGMAIPLWENKNSVKLAKAQTMAVQSLEEDNKLQFYNKLKTMYAKASEQQINAVDYRQSITTFDNSVLLKKALDKGEISLIEYMLELSIYYESMDNLLELEKETNNTIAELYQYM